MASPSVALLSAITVLALAGLAAGLYRLRANRAGNERRLGIMTDALPLSLAYIDADQRYRFVNASYARIHGRRVGEVVGRTIAELMEPELAAYVVERTRRVLCGETLNYEHRIRLPSDGAMHDLIVDLVPDVTVGGKVAGCFVLVRDVTEQARLEREVVRAAEAERLSVARDLHDSVGQTLTGVSLALGALARRLEAEGSGHTETVQSLIRTTQRTIAQTRQFTHLLAPTMQRGLFNALRALATEVSTLYNVRCDAQCPAEELGIGPAAAMHLYRIAQESVTNATRHGRARTVRIECQHEHGTLVLEVSDDGIGIPAPPLRRDGIGLKSMQYRARMLGGSLRVAAGRLGGTSVSCAVPIVVLGRELPVARDAETEALGAFLDTRLLDPTPVAAAAAVSVGATPAVDALK